MQPRTVRIAALAALLLSIAATTSHAQWRQLEQPYGGEILFLIDGLDGDIIAGSEFHGMHRSTDGGLTWSQFGPEQLPFPSLVTPEGTVFAFSDDRGGLFRSTDYGVTWAVSNAGVEERRGLFVTRLDAGNLFTATDSGMYRSTDNGATWTHSGLDSTELLIAAADPRGGVWVSREDGGLYHSVDTGKTWTEVPTTAETGATAFAFPADGSVVIGTFAGVHRSTDGETFAPLGPDSLAVGPLSVRVLPNGDIVAGSNDDGAYRMTTAGVVTKLGAPLDESFSLTTSGENIIVGYEGRGIYTSTDGGARFTQRGLERASEVERLEKVGDHVYAFTARGALYRSSGNLATWEDLDLPAGASPSIARTQNGILYVVGDVRDVWRSTDDGTTWVRTAFDADDAATQVFALDNGEILVRSFEGLFLSSDSGATWRQTGAAIAPYALALGANGHLWGIGSSSLYHSTDDGATWSTIDLPSDSVSGFGDIVATGNGAVILSAEWQDVPVLLRSTDDGATWSRTTLDCDAFSPPSLSINDEGVVVAVSACAAHVSHDGGVTYGLVELPEDVRGRAGLMHGDLLVVSSSDGLYAQQFELEVDDESRAASTLGLSVSPNPATDALSIDLDARTPGRLMLTLVDTRGATVATLHDAGVAAGRTRVAVDLPESLPGGTYMLHARIGDAERMMVVRIVR